MITFNLKGIRVPRTSENLLMDGFAEMAGGGLTREYIRSWESGKTMPCVKVSLEDGR